MFINITRPWGSILWIQGLDYLLHYFLLNSFIPLRTDSMVRAVVKVYQMKLVYYQWTSLPERNHIKLWQEQPFRTKLIEQRQTNIALLRQISAINHWLLVLRYGMHFHVDLLSEKDFSFLLKTQTHAGGKDVFHFADKHCLEFAYTVQCIWKVEYWQIYFYLFRQFNH